MDFIIAVFLVVCSTLLTLAVQRRSPDVNNQNNIIKKSLKNKVSSKKLKKHSNEFNKKEILKIDDNVYVAIGYGLANSIMIVGDTGVIIIDTLESVEVAREVKAAFSEISSKPIVGIVLTHFHADHSSGTQAFLDDAENDIDIYAHETFPKYFSQVMDVRSKITFKRAVRQFGTEIPDDVKENAGIGLNLKLDGSSTTSYIFPTKTFKDKMDICLAGVDLELIHAPGETNDQIIVWYKAKEILFPADNIYKAFPNLYAIRGCMHRDTLQWVAALDIMIKLKPEILVPQHTRPLHGGETILDTLVSYRDAIQYVHDQTVRFMNKGLTAQEIADIVELPPHLINHPYLIEYYGTVEWSVKAVYHGYIGWFSGRPADLHPMPRTQEAALYLELAGGPERVLEAAEKAAASSNFQWALQLTDLILDAGQQTEEDIGFAKDLRSTALVELAGTEVSAPGMNWYLTEDLVMKGLKIVPSQRAMSQRIMKGSVRSLFDLLTCMLDAEATENTILNTLFKFTDSDTAIAVTIRRGIAIVNDKQEDIDLIKPDITVTTTETVWRQIVAKEKSALAAAATGSIKVEPGIAKLAEFFANFDLSQD